MSIEEAQKFLQCRTRADLADFFGVSKSTLTYFAYGRGKKYKTFKIPKKSGGSREIAAPIDGLKETQKKLAKILELFYSDPPNPAHGFVTSRSIVTNAEPHLRKRLVLNLDLKDFFPSVGGHRVYGLFKAQPFYFNKEVASTLAALCSKDNALPQGAPTSPIISNMICFRLDRALMTIAARERATYTRYADDITFSTTKTTFPRSILENPDAESPVLGADLVKCIQENGFTVNQSKVRLSAGGSSKYVTGLKVNAKLNVSRKFVRHIRAMLNDWNKRGLKAAHKTYNAKHNSGGVDKDFISVVQGKLSHLRNIKAHTDLTYRRLFNRFVVLEAKGRVPLPLEEIQDLMGRVFVVESGSRQATGFILNERFMVTCRHTMEVEAGGQFPKPVERELAFFAFNDFPEPLKRHAGVDESYTSHEFDVALIDVAGRDKTPEKSLYCADPNEPLKVGVAEAYKVVGFPAYTSGSAPHIMPIAITGSRKNQYGVEEVYVDKKMVGGLSGAPVLNVRNQVVGMAIRGTSTRATGDDSAGYIFIPLKEILRFAAAKGLAPKEIEGRMPGA